MVCIVRVMDWYVVVVYYRSNVRFREIWSDVAHTRSLSYAPPKPLGIWTGGIGYFGELSILIPFDRVCRVGLECSPLVRSFCEGRRRGVLQEERGEEGMERGTADGRGRTREGPRR